MRIQWLLVFMLILTTSAFSTTLHVPGSYPTIQDAINAASNGDTVLVASGTYFECIDFSGKAIVVISDSGPAATTIDGNRNSSVVSFKNNEGLDSRLEGFTVTNGRGTGDVFHRRGAGVYVLDASPTLHGNIIRDNCFSGLGQVDYTYGGGIYLKNSDAVISDNIITENDASPYIYSSGTGYGGGIYSLHGSPIITGNTITYNRIKQEYFYIETYGGGLFFYGEGQPIVDNNIISHNSNQSGVGSSYTTDAFGGGIYNHGMVITITNNTITDNLVESGGDEGDAYGGGICCDGGSCTLQGNTIQNNTARAVDDGWGGGVFMEECSATITNNLVHNNEANYGGGIGLELLTDVLIEGNTFSNNLAERGEGGGLWCKDIPTAVIAGNHVFRNEAPRIGYNWGEGGGIKYRGGETLAFVNNMIAYNSAYTSGGLFIGFPEHALVANNTITCNTAIYATGGAYIWSDDLTLVNTIIWGNDCSYAPELFPFVTELTYCNIGGGWAGVGNIDTDPQFVDPAGLDFTLSFGSSCIDVGDGSIIGLPDLDFEGDYRIADGDADGMPAIDMGADELLTLKGSSYTLSTLYGGTIDLAMDLGTSNGNRLYAILGGMSGTAPGTSLPGGHVTLPVNWDIFTDIIWANMNTPFFHNFLGTLDATGKTDAQIWFDRLHPLLLGETMVFAATCNNPFNVVTNFILVDIVE